MLYPSLLPLHPLAMRETIMIVFGLVMPASVLRPVVPWATVYLPSEIEWTVHLGKTIGITPVLIRLWDIFFLLPDVAGLDWKLTPSGNLAKFDEFYWYSPHHSGHTVWRCSLAQLSSALLAVWQFPLWVLCSAEGFIIWYGSEVLGYHADITFITKMSLFCILKS